MAIYVDATGTLSDEFSAAIGERVRVVDSVIDAAAALAADAGESLVVIGPDADAHDAFELAASNRVSRPEVAVVLVRRRIDSLTLNAAMRAGVREVVRAVAIDALTEACSRARTLTDQLARVHRAESLRTDTPAGTIVTVFSAKGGCGKTTIATNFAAVTAASGARVCLVDLDLPFGDVAIMLQLNPQRSLADAVSMSGHIDEIGVRSIATTHSSGIDVMVAPVDPGDAERITPALVTDLLSQLKAMYDVVVVDTPPAFTEQVLAALDVTDVHLLVATLDIPAVKNLKLTLEMLDMLGARAERQRLVLNRSDAKVGLTREDVERALHRPISCEIPSSRDVPAAVNRATPLVLEQPTHPVSSAMRSLVDAAGLGANARPASHKQLRSRRVVFWQRGSVPA